jgi:hypothetical protein
MGAAWGEDRRCRLPPSSPAAQNRPLERGAADALVAGRYRVIRLLALAASLAEE